jgi:hypothetical protein
VQFYREQSLSLLGGIMNLKSLVAAFLLIIAFAAFAPTAASKDKRGQRGMLESMQSVPCGAKERGLTGLGSMIASVGVEHVNSHEQLCPQYLLRTDEMDYHIRPMDLKHAVVLPIGKEAEFKIKRDRLILRIVDGDKKQQWDYQVVSMQPIDPAAVESGANRPAEPPATVPPNPNVTTPNQGTVANTAPVTARPPQL